MTSCTVHSLSAKAERYHRSHPRKISRPWLSSMPPWPWATKSGATSPSTASRSPRVKRSSNQRSTMLACSGVGMAPPLFVAGAGSARDRLPAARPVVVAPGDEVPQEAQVVIGAAEAQEEVRDAVLHVAVGVLDLIRPDRYGALYLRFVAPDLLAPVVEDAALAGGLLGIPEPVPDVGVLGDDAQGNLLASAADEDRDLSRRRRIQLPEPLLDDGHRGVEVPQPAPRRPELVAVLVVVLLKPARTDTEYQT